MRWHQLTLLIGSSTLKTRVWDRNERLWEAQVHQPGQRQPALSCCRWLVQWHEAAYCSVPERFGHTAGTPELWNQVSSKTSTWMKKRRSAVRIFCASAISTWTWAHCMRIQRGCLHAGGWAACCGNVSAPVWFPHVTCLHWGRRLEQKTLEAELQHAFSGHLFISYNNTIWKKKTAPWWWKVWLRFSLYQEILHYLNNYFWLLMQ